MSWRIVVIASVASFAAGCVCWDHHHRHAGVAGHSHDCCSEGSHSEAKADCCSEGAACCTEGAACCEEHAKTPAATKSKSASGTKVVSPASENVKKEIWDVLASHVGEWEITTEDGKVVPVLSVKMTSGGTAIQETIFPGSEHEMLNIYHLDGDSVLMTHYCHAGNQPRMRAKEAKDGTIEFVADGCSNLTSVKDGFMGSMTLVQKDADTMEQTWYWWENGTTKPGFAGTYKRKK